MTFSVKNKKASKGVLFLKLCVVLLLALAVTCLLVVRWYNGNLKAISPESGEKLPLTISEGSSVASIAAKLEERSIIKSATAFEWHVRLNDANLQAGEFTVSPSNSVSEIVDILSFGQKESRAVTILPGLRLDQISESLVSQGFSAADVDAALDIRNYIDHPLYAYLQETGTLEGYLFPETFFAGRETTAVEIVEKSLDQMNEAFDRDILTGLANQDVTIPQAVIFASIVEKEVSNEDDKPKVAQVFLKRYREGIQLGSDVTFFYAAEVFGGRASPSLDNPYNTRLYGGLPPGPISNFSKSTLRSVAYPADTEYLYFVAGDNGTTYFNETLAGHNRDAATYCIELCKLP
ncbi:MAG: endolytic transglycosylase MltG [Patescibacteria group bacterium]